MARHFLDVFGAADYIVVPSGSCTSMVSHHYDELFQKEPESARGIAAPAAQSVGVLALSHGRARRGGRGRAL